MWAWRDARAKHFSSLASPSEACGGGGGGDGGDDAKPGGGGDLDPPASPPRYSKDLAWDDVHSRGGVYSPLWRGEATASGQARGSEEYLVKSRVPLALRQLFLYAQLTYYTGQCLLYAARAWTTSQAHWLDASSYLLLALSLGLVVAADSLDYRFRQTRRQASPALPLLLLLVAAAQALSVSGCALFAEDGLSLRAGFWLSSLGLVALGLHAATQPLWVERLRRPPNPEQEAYDLYQVLLFWWFTPILDAGARLDKQVEAADLPPLMWRDSAAFNTREFGRILGAAEARDYPKPRRLWFKLWRLTAPWFLASGVAQLLAFFTPYIQIVSVNLVLSWLEHTDRDDPSPTFVVKLAFAGLFFGPLLSACSSVVQVLSPLPRRSHPIVAVVFPTAASRIPTPPPPPVTNTHTHIHTNDYNCPA